MLTLAGELERDAKFALAKEGLLLAGRELIMIGDIKWSIKLPIMPSCVSWDKYIVLGFPSVLILIDEEGRKVRQLKVGGRVISCHINGDLIAVGLYKDGSNFVELIKLNGGRVWAKETPWLPKGVYVGEEEVAIASGHAMLVDLEGRIRWRKWLGTQLVARRNGLYVFDSWKGVVELSRGELRVLFPERVKSMDFLGGLDLYLTSNSLVIVGNGKTLIEAEEEASKAVFWKDSVVVVGRTVKIYKLHRSLYELMGVGAEGEGIDNSTQRRRGG